MHSKCFNTVFDAKYASPYNLSVQYIAISERSAHIQERGVAEIGQTELF